MKRLQRAWQSGEVAHAYCIAGAKGSGKKTVARLFAQALVCAGREKPCGVCLPCRKAAEGNHPDVHWLRPEKASLGVEEIRTLLEKLSVRPYEAERVVAVIDEADKMTVQAQNALLKSLEEPPERVVFLLLGQKTESFLPTILSRVVTLPLVPLCEDEVTAALRERGMADDMARMGAQLSGGSVGQALALAKDDGYWEMRKEAMGVLADLIRSAGAEVPGASAYLRDNRKRLGDILSVWEWLLRDALAIASGAPAAMADADVFIGAAARRYGTVVWSRLLALLIRMKRALAANVQASSVTDTMLMLMWEELALWRS